jgi:plasmid stabilization system protein ParE
LRGVHAHIAMDNPQAAARVVRRIKTCVEKLASFPNAGRIGQVDGTRELVVPGLPYIVVYRLNAESVEILRVFHSATDWPGVLQ